VLVARFYPRGRGANWWPIRKGNFYVLDEKKKISEIQNRFFKYWDKFDNEARWFHLVTYTVHNYKLRNLLRLLVSKMEIKSTRYSWIGYSLAWQVEVPVSASRKLKFSFLKSSSIFCRWKYGQLAINPTVGFQ
jgi:hypothetical protein